MGSYTPSNRGFSFAENMGHGINYYILPSPTAIFQPKSEFCVSLSDLSILFCRRSRSNLRQVAIDVGSLACPSVAKGN